MKTLAQLRKELLDICNRGEAVAEKLGVAPNKEVGDKLRAEHDDLMAQADVLEAQIRHREALGPEPELVDAQFTHLERSVNLGRYIGNVLGQGELDGQERELNSELGLSGDMVPWSALLETRDVTPAPNEVPGNQMPILNRVFADTASIFLGVGMSTVPVGEALFPVLSTGFTAGFKAKDAAADEPAGAFAVTQLALVRLTSSFVVRVEDLAVLPNMDSALRTDLRGAVGEKLDQQIVAGDGQAPNLGGFLGSGIAAPGNLAGETGYETHVKTLSGEVDGRNASAINQVGLLVGGDTFEHASVKYRADSTWSGFEQSALGTMQALAGGLLVSAHVPAVAAKCQDGIVHKGPGGAAVAPMWQGLRLVPDSVSLANKGQVRIVAIALHNFKILRAARYTRVRFQVQA